MRRKQSLFHIEAYLIMDGFVNVENDTESNKS